MKKALVFILSLLLALTLLSGCASDLAPLTTKDGATKETEEKTQTESEKESKEETKKTEEKEEKIMQKEDPAKDDTLNILMIGNSFCYYYVEELYGIAEAAGVKLRVCNVYYSGCNVKQHWAWFLENNNPYQFFTTDEKGRRGVKSVTLKQCLRQQNWDVITLQSAGGTLGVDVKDTEKLNAAIEAAKPAAKGLFNYIKTQFPQSDFYWHGTWAYEVGYNRSNGKIETAEQQENQHQANRIVHQAMAQDNNVPIIPTGEAWYLARRNPVVGDTLCARKGIKEDQGDKYHDGDLGGGQYLNACVWFEVLTGKSCIGNSYRPNYTLSEEKIEALQEAAHKAVAAEYGANHAK